MKKTIFLLIFILIVLGGNIYAQGALCADIEPFCAGEERLTFPNSNFSNSSLTSGEIGPDYNCLEEQPYPSWFFLQIENSGDLTFRISQNSNEAGNGAFLDVDFVVWGPFNRDDEYCSAASLSASNVVDCSYLPDAIETMSIPQAQENEIYVVVITNFQQVPGFITLEQTNTGQGSTDCSILEFDLGDNISVCDETEYVLDGTTDEDATYQWYIFNENSSEYEELPGETDATFTVTRDGNYKLIVTDPVENKTEEDDVTVTFYESPIIASLPDVPSCNIENSSVDLTQNSSTLIDANASGGSYQVEYYDSVESAGMLESIQNPEVYPFEEGKTIYAKIFDETSGCSSELADFQLIAFDFPEYELSEFTIFCIDLSGNILNPVTIGEELGEGYEYEWRTDGNLIGNDAVIEIVDFPQNGVIYLTITHPESGCKIDYVTNAIQVSRPEIVNIEITGSDFGEGYVVIASPENFMGDDFASFEYRLDSGTWQDSPEFNDVPAGSHTIFVRETNGCGETSSESFFLVGYPRFFTPNGDGYNDTWRLITDENISVQSLYVFDRYGKLIIQLNPQNGVGWNGKFNGNDLPSTDYWFRVEFIDERTGETKEYMSNFSLIR